MRRLSCVHTSECPSSLRFAISDVQSSTTIVSPIPSQVYPVLIHLAPLAASTRLVASPVLSSLDPVPKHDTARAKPPIGVRATSSSDMLPRPNSETSRRAWPVCALRGRAPGLTAPGTRGCTAGRSRIARTGATVATRTDPRQPASARRGGGCPRRCVARCMVWMCREVHGVDEGARHGVEEHEASGDSRRPASVRQRRTRQWTSEARVRGAASRNARTLATHAGLRRSASTGRGGECLARGVIDAGGVVDGGHR